MCIEVELLISKGLPLPSVVSDMFYTIISLILASWLSDWLEGDQEVSCSAGSPSTAAQVGTAVWSPAWLSVLPNRNGNLGCLKHSGTWSSQSQVFQVQCLFFLV